ncbi:hypothetical protein E2562_014328 [Oryza meyeriana var. granulata]|uniref:VWFA domain-containing protein n=1 Tax=Oryza meyeriana var. granulata TaxID=110450 RepID=A0A6G1C6V1_9ORYZ|nr:hypothetical protein E2562_014328 [Oryza meyeriana var. granulata]
MQLRILSPNKVVELERVTSHRPAGLPVLVRVMAPAVEYVKLVSIDVIVVLDISVNGDDDGEMGLTNKLELAKKAVELVMAKLHDKDRLAIIPVQSSSTITELPRLSVMSAGGRRDASAKVQSLLPSKMSTATLANDKRAKQTKVDVVCNQSSGATLSAIESGQFMSSIHGGRASCSISVGALHAGAVKNFLVYLDVPKDGHRHNEESSSTPADLLTARVKYVTAEKKEQVDQANLGAAENDLGAAADIAAQILRVQVADVVTRVLKYKDRKFRATGELHEGWMRVKSSEHGQAAGWARLAGLEREVAAMEASLLHGSAGLSHLLSWLSFHNMSEQLPSKLELDPQDSTATGDQPGLPPFQLQPERPA